MRSAHFSFSPTVIMLGRSGPTPSKVISLAIDGADINVDSVVSKLAFIAKIKKGEKIDAECSIIPDTKWYNFLRTIGIGKYSKEQTLAFIKQTADQALDLARVCIGSQDPFHRNVGRMIIAKLKDVKIGTKELKDTYEEYRLFLSQLETFEELLDAKIKALGEGDAAEVDIEPPRDPTPARPRRVYEDLEPEPGDD